MWFLSKIKYGIQDEMGKWKTYTEQFLHDGVSFTEVEAQIFGMLEGRLTDFEIKAIAQIKFENVYEPHVGGDFYKVTVLTEDKYDEKKTITSHLVAAADVVDAESRAEKYMSAWLSDTTITGVVKSPILGVWHPVSQDWQDDFKQRMAKLAEEGHESGDVNQTTIFDKEGKPKRYDQPDDFADRLAPLPNVGPDGVSARKIRSDRSDFSQAVADSMADNMKDGVSVEVNGKKGRKGITFRKRNGDPVDAE